MSHRRRDGSRGPLSRGGGGRSARRADQFRNVQARSRGGGEEPVTAARRASVVESAGVAGAVSEDEAVDVPQRSSRETGVESPGGSASGETNVRPREGAGQEDRLSEGHDGQRGGASSPQHRSGIAAAGAGQSASTGGDTAACPRPASSPRTRDARDHRKRLIGIGPGL